MHIPTKGGLVMLAVTAVVVAATGCGEPGSDAAAECPEDVMTEESGLKYEELECGEGQEAQRGDVVTVHYTGTLENGEKFDSSRDRGEPFTLQLGAGNVIEGWEQGIPGMNVGGERKLIIPPELGYGEAGSPPVIPPNATLIFEVELLKIEEEG